MAEGSSHPKYSEHHARSLPGYRFRPTDHELLFYYLLRKLLDFNVLFDMIQDVDFTKCEPWDLPAKANNGDDSSLYFFSRKDKKYPTGTRTNRATDTGYWKATGRDRTIKSKQPHEKLVGMKKTLVFYRGRAPSGEKTDWIMHEYRLEDKSKPDQQEWVVSRVFRKESSPIKKEEPISAPISSPELTYDINYNDGYIQYQNTHHHSMKSEESACTSNSVGPIYENSGYNQAQTPGYFPGATFPGHGQTLIHSNSSTKRRYSYESDSHLAPSLGFVPPLSRPLWSYDTVLESPQQY